MGGENAIALNLIYALKILDTKMVYADVMNTPRQHLCVGVFSLVLSLFFVYVLEIAWSTAFARVSFILLFFTLLIGPIIRLKVFHASTSSLQAPLRWRGELGIWFTITALLHFAFAMSRPFIGWSILSSLGGGVHGGGFGLANLLGYIALVFAILLAVTSFNKVIRFLGLESWKWLQNFTYVVFYLVVGHLLYFQFFSTRANPDWFGYMSIVMALVIVIVQIAAFVEVVVGKRG
jgi:sulfoxide reductase heme-binding subunit YedZ